MSPHAEGTLQGLEKLAAPGRAGASVRRRADRKGQQTSVFAGDSVDEGYREAHRQNHHRTE